LRFDFVYALKGIGGTVLVFGLLNITGWYHGKKWSHRKPNQIIHFLPIQANIGNAEKIMAERGYGYQDFIVQRFIQLSREALAQNPQAQVLVWPESAIPDYLDQEFSERRRPQWIKSFLTETKRYLITGAYSKEVKPRASGVAPYRSNDDDLAYNALFILGPQGDPIVPPYRKKHLLAFGEYTPLAQWFPKLNDFSPSGKGFARGPGPQTLKVNGPNSQELRLAPQICYEALYPDFTRQGVLGGAQILINLTNDSWFGVNSEPFQHLSMTFARAIENRRPLLRVTNTGFTSAIEASGRLFPQSPLYKEWSGVFSMGYEEKPPMTLYTRYGGFWPFVVLLAALGGFVGILRTRRE
jgi:apolipoprotein N-acyltransferase